MKFFSRLYNVAVKPMNILTVKQRSLLFFQITKGIENNYREKNFKKIHELYETSKTNRLHLTLDSYVLILQSMRDHVKNSFKVYQNLKKEKLKPNEKILIILLSNCSEGKESSGDYSSKAFKVLLEETKRWEIPKTTLMYNLAMKSCILHMEQDKVIQIYEDMETEKVSPDVYTFSLMFKVLSQFGNTKKCLFLLDKLKELDLKPDVYLYNSLLTSCKNDQNEMVLPMFKKMIEEEGIRPSVHTFSILLGAIRKNHEYHKSVLIYKELVAQEVKGDEKLLNNMAVTLSMGGFGSESLECIRKMKKQLFHIEKRTYEILFEKLKDPYRKQLIGFANDDGIKL
jgi:hypothetical protein